MANQHAKSRIPSRNGFTLVELLVSIAIMGLLVGILLPALSAAKETAQSSVCLSNIRQIAIANLTYAVDNQSYLVPAAYRIDEQHHRWHGYRENTSDPFDPALGPLHTYLGPTGRIKQCPTYTDFKSDQPGILTLTFEAGAGGYGYNNQYLGSRDDLFTYPENSKHTARTSDVIKPTHTAMFADTGMYRDDGGTLVLIEYSFIESPYFIQPNGPQFHWGHPTPAIHFRHHNKTANAAWVDGHAAAQSIAWSSLNFYAATLTVKDLLNLGSGWFGPEDSVELFDLD